MNSRHPLIGRGGAAELRWLRVAALWSTVAAAGALSACGGSDDDDDDRPPPTPAALSCDDTIKSGFKPDANTSVLLVKSFKTGDPLRCRHARRRTRRRRPPTCAW